MASMPTTTVRIEPELKEQANKVFDGLGISLSAAVNAFLKAVVTSSWIAAAGAGDSPSRAQGRSRVPA